MVDSFALIDILLQLEKVTQRKISPGKVSPRDMDTVNLMLATADRVVNAKPSPELVQLALRELGVQPGEAWMVGDSRFDRAAAQSAGVFFVGLGIDGDRRIERLSEIA